MKKIKVIESYAVKAHHEIINLSMIMMYLRIFDCVTYISGKSACDNLRKQYVLHDDSPSANLLFKTVKIFETDSKKGAFLRILHGFFITIYYYLLSPINQVLSFNHTNPLSMPFILVLNIFLRKKIIFVMHGELELQYQSVPLYKPAGWYRLCYKLSFKYLLAYTPAVLLVLGDSIKENICQLYPQISERIITICHPYFIDNSRFLAADFNKMINIGTIGAMNKKKGIHSLIYLSTLLEDEIVDQKISLKSIGRVDDFDISLCPHIEWVGNIGLMPREIFDYHVNKLDYILYLYPIDSYKLTASGAILDAVKLHKPIISLHNQYFDFLMGNSPIGYMAETVEELAIIIKKILNSELVDDFTKQFELLAKKISISHNTMMLKKELENHCFV